MLVFISLPNSHPGIKPQLTLTPVTALCTSPSSDAAPEELVPGDELNPQRNGFRCGCVCMCCVTRAPAALRGAQPKSELGCQGGDAAVGMGAEIQGNAKLVLSVSALLSISPLCDCT